MSTFGVDFSDTVSGGLGLEFVFLCGNNSDEYYKFGLYDFSTMEARCKVVSYGASNVSLTGNNVTAAWVSTSNFTVTALNDYYLYRFAPAFTNAERNNGVGLSCIGKNATDSFSPHSYKKVHFFVSSDPDLVSKFTETWES